MNLLIIIVVVPKEHSEDRHLMPDLDRGQGAGSGEEASLGQVLLHLTEAAAPVLPDPGGLWVLIMITTIVISVNVTIRVKQIFGNISLISERLLPS